jgi:hypothetical protein
MFAEHHDKPAWFTLEGVTQTPGGLTIPDNTLDGERHPDA